MTPAEKAAEEAKRERNWDPQIRWRAIQNMIAWADAQQPTPRNSPQGCLREQRRKLKQRNADSTGG